MIVRVWSAKSTPRRAPKYVHHFREEVLPELRSLDGFVEARILSRSADGEVQILVETAWTSWEAVDKFARPKRDSAVVADEAAKLLTSYDRRVRHYELQLHDGQHVPVPI